MFRSILFVPLLSFNTSTAQFFEEVTLDVGINHRHISASFIGGGVALFDFNNDGLLDIYLTGGKKEDALFIQKQDEFFFMNIADSIGLTNILDEVHTMGVAIGDINNDGWEDVFLTTYINEPNKLLLNQQGQGFSEISISAGVAESAFSTTSSFADFNKDGFLDLHVSNYVFKTHFITGPNGDEIAHECSDDFLYINNGDATFSSVKEDYGFENLGCTLASMFTDFDGDDDLDLLLVNDFGSEVEENKLMVNQYPSKQFLNEAKELGTDEGIYSMGIASSDYDRDGDLDYYITNIGKNVLLNQDDLGFTNLASTAGVEDEFEDGGFAVGWGCNFIDFNNDGWDDLFVSNGFIPSIESITNPESNRSNFFINQKDGTFLEAREESGLGDGWINRGSAMGDLDNDGDLDLVVVGLRSTSNNEPYTKVYLNNDDGLNNYVQISLVSQDNSPINGTRCKLFAEGEVYMKDYQISGSHCSSNSRIIHFGLGQITQIDSFVVFWTNGDKTSHFNLSVNARNEVFSAVVSSSNDKSMTRAVCSPNPVRDVIHLETTDQEITTISIYDIMGKLEFEGEFYSKIDLSELSKGLKSLVFRSGNNKDSYSIRFIKE